MTVDHRPTGYIDPIWGCKKCGLKIHESAIRVFNIPGHNIPKCEICKIPLVLYEEDNKTDTVKIDWTE